MVLQEQGDGGAGLEAWWWRRALERTTPWEVVGGWWVLLGGVASREEWEEVGEWEGGVGGRGGMLGREVMKAVVVTAEVEVGGLSARDTLALAISPLSARPAAC